jgi:SAM-dependent methyltransferase
MWQTDIALNSVKAFLPFQSVLRSLKRRWRPHAVDRPNSEFAVLQALEQIRDLSSARVCIDHAEILDLGSGWNPTAPLVLVAAGAARVHLTDIERLLDAETLRATAVFLLERGAAVARALGISEALLRERLDPGTDHALEPLLKRLNLTYSVPFDSATAPAVDLIVSRTTLEHIPPETLLRLYGDFQRCLRPGGAMAHIIDNSDHREHRDKRLSRIDFLRYPASTWRLLCLNKQDYCNRLRHSDHIALIRAAGFRIELERAEIDEKAAIEATRMRLAEEFRGKQPRDLAVITSHVIARPESPALRAA